MSLQKEIANLGVVAGSGLAVPNILATDVAGASTGGAPSLLMWSGRWAPSRRCARHDFPGRGRYRDICTAPRITAGSLLVALPVLACSGAPTTGKQHFFTALRANHDLGHVHPTSAYSGRAGNDDSEAVSMSAPFGERPTATGTVL